MGLRDGLGGGGGGGGGQGRAGINISRYKGLQTSTHKQKAFRKSGCPHQLTKERSDCSVEPQCSKYIGQSNSE